MTICLIYLILPCLFSASGEECTTPKRNKNDAYGQSHLAPPNASPGPHHGPHDDFEMNTPSWPRTPASPVSHANLINTHKHTNYNANALNYFTNKNRVLTATVDHRASAAAVLPSHQQRHALQSLAAVRPAHRATVHRSPQRRQQPPVQPPQPLRQRKNRIACANCTIWTRIRSDAAGWISCWHSWMSAGRR